MGRLVVVRDGAPVAFPVNYTLDGRTVAVRTDAGTKLEWGTLGPVAFEVDDIDRATHQGWSVLVQGTGRDVTEGVDAWSQGLRTSGLEPWVGGDKGHWIAIASPTITGRRIRPRRPEDPAPPSRAALSRRARRPARRCAGAWRASWARPRPAGA